MADTTNWLAHYGRKGMKWHKHIFGKDNTAKRFGKNLTGTETVDLGGSYQNGTDGVSKVNTYFGTSKNPESGNPGFRGYDSYNFYQTGRRNGQPVIRTGTAYYKPGTSRTGGSPSRITSTEWKSWTVSSQAAQKVRDVKAERANRYHSETAYNEYQGTEGGRIVKRYLSRRFTGDQI